MSTNIAPTGRRAQLEKSVADLTAQLNSARALKFNVNNDKYADAMALYDEIRGVLEERRGELARLGVTVAAADSTADVATAIRRVNDRRRSWGQERAIALNQILGDAKLSGAYKTELVERWDAENAAQAEGVARLAWNVYQGRVEAVRKDIVTASAENSARYDLGAVGVLIKDFSAQIAAPPVSQGMRNAREHRVRFIAEVLDRVEASGDLNAMRAARIAAGPPVNDLMGSGEDGADALSRELNRRVATLARRERGRVPELEESREHLHHQGRELRGAILALEQVVSGNRMTMFGVSPWQARILGESMETFGGGVGQMVTK